MGKRDDQKTATREKIIKAATHAFHHNGYDEVTVRGLAKAIGMSTGAVFAHFTDKAALFEEAMGKPAPDVIAFLDEVIGTIRTGSNSAVQLAALRERASELRGHLKGHHA